MELMMYNDGMLTLEHCAQCFVLVGLYVALSDIKPTCLPERLSSFTVQHDLYAHIDRTYVVMVDWLLSRTELTICNVKQSQMPTLDLGEAWAFDGLLLSIGDHKKVGKPPVYEIVALVGVN